MSSPHFFAGSNRLPDTIFHPGNQVRVTQHNTPRSIHAACARVFAAVREAPGEEVAQFPLETLCTILDVDKGYLPNEKAYQNGNPAKTEGKGFYGLAYPYYSAACLYVR